MIFLSPPPDRAVPWAVPGVGPTVLTPGGSPWPVACRQVLVARAPRGAVAAARSGLELDPAVPGEVHLGPRVRVLGRDHVGVPRTSPLGVAASQPGRITQQAGEHGHRVRRLHAHAGVSLGQEAEQAGRALDRRCGRAVAERRTGQPGRQRVDLAVLRAEAGRLRRGDLPERRCLERRREREVSRQARGRGHGPVQLGRGRLHLREGGLVGPHADRGRREHHQLGIGQPVPGGRGDVGGRIGQGQEDGLRAAGQGIVGHVHRDRERGNVAGLVTPAACGRALACRWPAV